MYTVFSLFVVCLLKYASGTHFQSQERTGKIWDGRDRIFIEAAGVHIIWRLIAALLIGLLLNFKLFKYNKTIYDKCLKTLKI